MPRFCLTLVSVLAVLTAARGLAQTAATSPDFRLSDDGPAPVGSLLKKGTGSERNDAEPEEKQGVRGACPLFQQAPSAEIETRPAPEEFNVQRLPSVGSSPQLPQFPNPTPVAGETPVTDAPVGEALVTNAPLRLDGSAEASPVVSLRDFLGYRYSSSALAWIPGNGDEFGIFSIEWDHYQKSGINNGIGFGAGFHFLSGPVQTDMPPLVFDFSLGYQIRQQLGPLHFDLATSVLAASDFKGNARKGILFPSHAVGFLTVGPTVDLVFGVDYVDRGDVKLLPVGGLIWMPNLQRRYELVFPRPRAVFQLRNNYRLYVSGELGGGTWAIERATFADDLATYRDIRICLGLESVGKDGQETAFEIGYLFDRRLQYTSNLGNMNLNDAVMLRLVTRY